MKEMEKIMGEAEEILGAWKPTKIHFGEGSIQQVGEVVKKYAKKTLLTIGKSSIKKSGVLYSISQALEKNSLPTGSSTPAVMACLPRAGAGI